MRIAVISAAFPPISAGESEHALHLCNHLAIGGRDVHLLTTIGAKLDVDLRFTVHDQMQTWSWKETPRLINFLRKCSPDVVLLIYSGWIYNSHPMITFAATLSKFVLPRVPFITQIEIEYTSLKAPLLVRALLKLLELSRGKGRLSHTFGTLLYRSNRVIVLSEKHRARLSHEFPSLATKFIAVPPAPLMHMCPQNNGFDRQAQRQRLGAGFEDFLIAYFGYVYKGKGMETLLRALRILKNRGKPVRLTVIGGGINLAQPSRFVCSLFELSRELNINERITWTGEYGAYSDEASRCLLAADACVLPFDRGVALNRSSLAAAAAHGLPIVTTRGDSLESAFADRQNLLLCPPKDPEALAGAVETLLERPALRETLRLGALELAHQWFSWDNAIDRIVEVAQ